MMRIEMSLGSTGCKRQDFTKSKGERGSSLAAHPDVSCTPKEQESCQPSPPRHKDWELRGCQGAMRHLCLSVCLSVSGPTAIPLSRVCDGGLWGVRLAGPPRRGVRAERKLVEATTVSNQEREGSLRTRVIL